MPRANRRDRRRVEGPALAMSRVTSGGTRQVRYAGTEWWVRHLTGAAGRSASQTYRCPGCAQEIRPGTAHVVVWPAHPIGELGGAADRRHWHTPCWTNRDRRPPRGSYR